MKFRLTVEVDVDIDTGGFPVDSDTVGQAIVALLKDKNVAGLMRADIANSVGWQVNTLAVTVPDAECRDNLD